MQKLAGVFILIAILILFLFGSWIGYLAVVAPDDLKPQQAAVFAAAAAIGGWLLTAYIARRNSIKQHTMTVLTQVRISAEMNNRIALVFKQFPPGVNMPADYANATSRGDETIRAASYILNYYEFLAAALHHNDLDHDLLKDCIRGQLCARKVHNVYPSSHPL